MLPGRPELVTDRHGRPVSSSVFRDDRPRLWSGDRRRPAKHRRKGECADPRPESGTRVGMGMRMHHAQLQALLEEMAWQPGVLWFAVTDENGKIIAHSDPQQVDTALYSPAQMRELKVGEQERWRRLAEPQPALEIYRQFRPLNPARGHHMGMMKRCNSALAQPNVPQVILSPLIAVSWMRRRLAACVT